MPRIAGVIVSVMLLSFSLSGCSDDETGPEQGHTPVDAALFVDGVEADPLLLVAGETVRVEVRFLNDEGEVITGIEEEHHTALRFSPEGLATTAGVAGANFQKDVTAQADAGAGDVMVGYGHDEEADELEFGPFPVSVVLTGAAR